MASEVFVVPGLRFNVQGQSNTTLNIEPDTVFIRRIRYFNDGSAGRVDSEWWVR